MKRVAQLIRTAGEIRRMIWASLPFRERLAQVLASLATSSGETFGTAMYGIFLYNGVVDNMPPIHGQPASEWLAKYPNASATELTRHLPAGYGGRWGNAIVVSLMRTHHSIVVVEDIMSTVLEKFLKSPPGKFLKPGWSRERAEKYVVTALKMTGINVLRRKKFELGEALVDRNDEGPGLLDRTPAPPEPEESEEEQEENFLKLLDKLRPSLKKIHPSAEQYLRLIVDGYTDTQIFGNPGQGRPSMLDNPYNKNGGYLTPSAWTTNYKNKLKKLFTPFLGEDGLTF